jgi:4-alpha-glucanotransferase
LWHSHGQPFREPAQYPTVSVATTGTHDTETLAAWWDQASAEERRGVAALEAVRRAAGEADVAARPFDDRLRDILLEAVSGAGSNLLLLPVQDLFGWRDRINDPASAGNVNWTYKLPWPVDRLPAVAEAWERQEALRALNERYSRV